MGKYVLGLVVSLLVAGCGTALKVSKVTPGAESTDGVVYGLPITRFEISVIQRVVECEDGLDDNNNPSEDLVASIKLGTEVEITPANAVDPNHLYAIDLESLSTLTNHASTSVEFYEDSYLLKSINASVDDKTSDIVVGAVGTLLDVAALSSKPAVGARGDAARAVHASVSPPKIRCLVEQEFRAANAKEAEVKNLTAELARKTSKMLALEKELADYRPGIDAVKEAELVDLVAEITATQALLANLEGQLAVLLKPITTARSVIWPKSDDNQCQQDQFYQLSEQVARSWWGRLSDSIDEDTKKDLADDLKGLIDDWSLSLALVNVDEIGVEINANNSSSNSICPLNILASSEQATTTDKKAIKKTNGIRYRTPVAGALWVCRDNSASHCRGSDKRLAELETAVAQLGFMSEMKIKAKPFESSAFSGAWSQAGYLKSAGYKKTRSVGEGLVDTAEGLVGRYDAYKERKAKALSNEVDRLTNELSLREKEIALSAAGEETATLTSQTALLNARKARLEAEMALEALGK